MCNSTLLNKLSTLIQSSKNFFQIEHPAFPRATDFVHRQSGQRLADEEKSGLKADLLRIIREEELELKADLIRVIREEVGSFFVTLM